MGALVAWALAALAHSHFLIWEMSSGLLLPCLGEIAPAATETVQVPLATLQLGKQMEAPVAWVLAAVSWAKSPQPQQQLPRCSHPLSKSEEDRSTCYLGTQCHSPGKIDKVTTGSCLWPHDTVHHGVTRLAGGGNIEAPENSTVQLPPLGRDATLSR